MSDLEAEFKKAVEAHRQGGLDAAEPVYRAVLDRDPDHADARHMMAVASLQRGRLAEAEADVRRAIAANPAAATYRNTLGNVLTAQGKPDEALAAFEAAAARDPAFPTATFNKGTTLLALARPREAEAAFRALLDAGVDMAQLPAQLATALIRQNRIADAVAFCRDRLSSHPDDPALRTNLASALELANDLEGAEAEARRVCDDDGADYPLARLILARTLRRRKRADEARDVLAPLLGGTLTANDRTEVLYEQGLILDVLGAHADAFAAFAESNAVRKTLPDAARCDAARYLRAVRAWRDWVEDRPPAAARRHGDGGDGGGAPVFFVGFPRSGTTLVEQMLMSHPRIVTTEEVSPLAPVEKAARAMADARGTAFPVWLDTAPEDDLASLRALFAAEADRIVDGVGGRVVLDKLPLNIVPLGLVERLWPDARVLVALRDPRDACLSCFIQRFSLNNAMANFLDIETTGTAYAEVMGLWLSYRERLALAFHEYRYEDLVDDFDGTVRGILDFVGVGWDDGVASYREDAKDRVIKTPSYREVTAPLHRKAVARWKGYEAQLAPILPTLAPFVRAFGYDD